MKMKEMKTGNKKTQLIDVSNNFSLLIYDF